MTWEADLLAGIGAPASPTNVRACDLWAASEGTLGDNNPLAISGRYPGATRCIAQCGTASEVWAYDTITDGVEATVAFMSGGNSAGIVAAFRQDAGLAVIWHAINTSPWCSGCQGGKYPVQLFNALVAQPQEEQMITAYEDSGGQRHVFVYDNGVVRHWWQDTAGPNAGHWNGPEQLP